MRKAALVPARSPAIDRLSEDERRVVVRMIAKALLANVLREADDADAESHAHAPLREPTRGTV